MTRAEMEARVRAEQEALARLIDHLHNCGVEAHYALGAGLVIDEPEQLHNLLAKLEEDA